MFNYFFLFFFELPLDPLNASFLVGAHAWMRGA
jgi:hypothetical protein